MVKNGSNTTCEITAISRKGREDSLIWGRKESAGKGGLRATRGLQLRIDPRGPGSLPRRSPLPLTIKAWRGVGLHSAGM
jgi:hypothetical protein